MNYRSTFRIKIQFIEFLCENSKILSPPPPGSPGSLVPRPGGWELGPGQGAGNLGGGLANMRLSRSEGGCVFREAKVDATLCERWMRLCNHQHLASRRSQWLRPSIIHPYGCMIDGRGHVIPEILTVFRSIALKRIDTCQYRQYYNKNNIGTRIIVTLISKVFYYLSFLKEI